MPAPLSPVPLSLGFCSFSFSLDAQPRDCASFLLRVLQGPRAGARTHPGLARPCPSHSGHPASSLGPLTPHPDPTELATQWAVPSGGRVGRSSSPSRRLESHAGTRRLAAGGAKLHTRRLLLPRRGREFRANAGFPGPFHSPPLCATPLHPCSALPLPVSMFLPGTPRSPLGSPSRPGRPLRPLSVLPASRLAWPQGVGRAMLLETRYPAPTPPRRGPKVNWKPIGTGCDRTRSPLRERLWSAGPQAGRSSGRSSSPLRAPAPPAILCTRSSLFSQLFLVHSSPF